MNAINYLSTPGHNVHPDLYLHRNVPLGNAPPQAPPETLQQHNRKHNILNIAGKKFLSLLRATKNPKLKEKRADTPIPTLQPPPILGGERTSTRLYNTRELWRKAMRQGQPVQRLAGLGTGGSVQKRDLGGQEFRFRSGQMEVAINTDEFSLHVKRWRPILEVIPEENEEIEEEEKEDQKESEREESEEKVEGKGVQ